MAKRRLRIGSILVASVMALAGPTDALSAARPGPAGGGAHSGGGGAHFGGGGGTHFSGFRFGGLAHFSGVHYGGNFARARFTSRRSIAPAFARRSSPAPSAVDRRIENGGLHRNDPRGRPSSRQAGIALRDRNALRSPGTRARLVASAATAGWHNGLRGSAGWWRHGNGGYGWVGPLFWPFAYYDIFNWVLSGYDDSFWDYGYEDIFAGLFAPYGYADLSGYLPPYSPASASDTVAAKPGRMDALMQMCGDEARDIADFPVDQLQQMVQLTDAEQTALNDLKDAMAKAAQGIKAACPTDIALTAPARLANMQQRIEAMIAAVMVVQPPLAKLYDLLLSNDEQKQQLTALAAKRPTRPEPTGAGAPDCGVGRLEWPTAAIEQAVHPTPAQQASLAALESDTATAAQMLRSACTADASATPPARLAAIGQRLDTMLQAVQLVRMGLNDFYGQLSDEQKARFEAIGPALNEPERLAANQARTGSIHHRGYSIFGHLEGFFRHLFRF